MHVYSIYTTHNRKQSTADILCVGIKTNVAAAFQIDVGYKVVSLFIYDA
jgi:predicted ATP-grasp superfamily ATP-dependent carboligase